MDRKQATRRKFLETVTAGSLAGLMAGSRESVAKELKTNLDGIADMPVTL